MSDDQKVFDDVDKLIQQVRASCNIKSPNKSRYVQELQEAVSAIGLAIQILRPCKDHSPNQSDQEPDSKTPQAHTTWLEKDVMGPEYDLLLRMRLIQLLADKSPISIDVQSRLNCELDRLEELIK